MTYPVIITEPALDDLYSLYHWVLEEAGRSVADNYYQRVEDRLRSLSEFPRRGTPRVEFGNGIRTIPFERRLTIFYRVDDGTVQVLRVLNGARETSGLFD